MSKLIIEIETENAAFEYNTEGEVNRILDNIKNNINYDYLIACGVTVGLKDINSNTVGTIKGVKDNV